MKSSVRPKRNTQHALWVNKLCEVEAPVNTILNLNTFACRRRTRYPVKQKTTLNTDTLHVSSNTASTEIGWCGAARLTVPVKLINFQVGQGANRTDGSTVAKLYNAAQVDMHALNRGSTSV